MSYLLQAQVNISKLLHFNEYSEFVHICITFIGNNKWNMFTAEWFRAFDLDPLNYLNSDSAIKNY